MSRKDFIESRYSRRLHGQQIPQARRLYIGPDDSSAWFEHTLVVIADYKWMPTGPAGATRGSLGEALTFGRPSSAGTDISVKITDFDRDVMDKLEEFFSEGTTLRLHVQGEEMIKGILVDYPYKRVIEEELTIKVLPLIGFRYSTDASMDIMLGAFRVGRSTVFSTASSSLFTVNDVNFADWIKEDDVLVIERAGTNHEVTVTDVTGSVVTISPAVTGLAADDPVYTKGAWFGSEG